MTPETSAHGELEQGRTSFAKHAWADAYARLASADRSRPLGLDDLERLATAAFLIGKDVPSAEAWARAHQEALTAGDAPRAARCAFVVGFQGFNIGDFAQAMGWLARASRVLDEAGADCVERGYLLIPAGIRAGEEGDASGAHAIFSQASEFAERFGDDQLRNLARYGQGGALIASGRIADGLALVDETMIAITAGEVLPSLVGVLYCSAIETFKGLFDLRRQQQWTATLDRWCESQPDLVPYRGQCMVYRAEIMRRHGAWPDAMDELVRAREWLARRPGDPAVGSAVYQQAELQRLSGDLAKAEELYREASRLGASPLPGLALLRLAQGHVETARASLRRALDETRDRGARAALLAAYVDVQLSGGDVRSARAAAGELGQTASGSPVPLLDAMAAQAMGAVLLAEGDAPGAITRLRSSWSAWRELDAPYDAARVRVLVGLACRALRDDDGAERELDAARGVFQELGAASDLAGVDGLSRTAKRSAVGGLTEREAEILRLIATGVTNRAIGAELVISEKTVARHVSNIFDKLGVSSRGRGDRLRLRAQAAVALHRTTHDAASRDWAFRPMRPRRTTAIVTATRDERAGRYGDARHREDRNGRRWGRSGGPRGRVQPRARTPPIRDPRRTRTRRRCLANPVGLPPRLHAGDHQRP